MCKYPTKIIISIETGEHLPFKQVKDVERIVTQLGKDDPLYYEQCRNGIARSQGIRVAALDDAIAKTRNGRPSKNGSSAKGRAIELYEPEPWPEAVSGAEVLDDALEAILRYMVIEKTYASSIVLWIAHSHVYNSFSHSPRLLVTAPGQDCGKTLLMTHLVGNTVRRPQPVELMKAAPFFRLAETYKPTFLIDEMDVFIKEDSDLLAAVNSGWEPHGCVLRCAGDDYDVLRFSTFCPVVMAGINLGKKLPATTISRSIVISLDRAAPDESKSINVFDSRKHQLALLNIGRQLSRWCIDNEKAISECEPAIPEKAVNRFGDKWKPLFSIAELAGGDWPERAKAAMFGQPDMSVPSKALQVLLDTREVIRDEYDNIHTKILIEQLCKLEDSRWSNYNSGDRDQKLRKITVAQLADLFRQFRISPKNVRAGADRKSLKGYDGTQLKLTFSRYLPPLNPPTLSVTPSQTSKHNAFKDNASVTSGNIVTDGKSVKASPAIGCDGVTDKKGNLC